ncbi:MAG: 30S ribosome-binding factor RbfA [Candidatus Pacebacteria bacterium]|nr:30S ribosome-binding factor RbfA [Candidatus Paceibacterota bacterium]MDD4074114.1 30S ribosome-binding factor RbfA [Candidatus Paceibacterota bacterium]
MFRIEKVNNLIKREIGVIILKEIDIFPGTLVTVTRVECSGNLFQCKVFISIIPENTSESVMALLNRNVYNIQQIINKKIKMRPVPKISFYQETKTAEAGKIEKLLSSIEKKD